MAFKSRPADDKGLEQIEVEVRIQTVVLRNKTREELGFVVLHKRPERIIDFAVVKLLQGEVSSELGDRAAHNSNFDWIDVWTKVDKVAQQSPGALRRSAADPCIQSENLLDLEMLGKFSFSAL